MLTCVSRPACHSLDSTPSDGATMYRLLGLSLALSVALLGSAQAANHRHHGGQHVVQNGKGRHEVHRTQHGPVSHAHVVNGKVKTVSVQHKGKELTVRKYKTRKRYHAAAPSNDQHYYVSTATPVAALQTIWIGFAFYNQFVN